VARNLIAGAINRRFQTLLEPFGRIDNFWLDGDEKRAEAIRLGNQLVKVEEQRQSLIMEVLGIPWYQDPWLDDSAELAAYFGSFLDPEKAQRLGELSMQAQFEAAAAQARNGIRLDSPEANELAAELIQRSNRRLAETLTPGELEELGIRLFTVSFFDVWKERRRFGEKLSGSELREVLRILKPDNLVFFDVSEELKYAQPAPRRRIERGNALRSLLGDQRFALFLQRHNGDFEQMPGHSDEGRPEPEVYLRMFELHETVAAQIEHVTGDETLTALDRESLVSDLLRQARETALTQMSAEAYRVYLKGGGGWLGAQGDSDAK
jgi:hypothetical protein